jgi:hypothetical protein
MFGGGVPNLHIHLGPHHKGDALNTQIRRGEIITEKLASGAERYVNEDFPPLPQEKQLAVAAKIKQHLSQSD